MDDMLATDKAAFTSNISFTTEVEFHTHTAETAHASVVPSDFFNSGLSPERHMLAGHNNCKFSLISLERKDLQ